MSKIRFLLIFPVLVFVFVTFFLLGTYTMERIVSMFCTDASGMTCFDPGWENIGYATRMIFSSLAAFFMVMISFLLAPYRKVLAATYVYIGGVIIALVIAGSLNSEWGSFFGATTAGLISLYIAKTLNKYGQSEAAKNAARLP
jgi:uncharacterized BrkB/YihY/UPF0761 family membrane protein